MTLDEINIVLIKYETWSELPPSDNVITAYLNLCGLLGILEQTIFIPNYDGYEYKNKVLRTPYGPLCLLSKHVVSEANGFIEVGLLNGRLPVHHIEIEKE